MSNSTGYHTDMSKERVALAVIGTLIYIGGFVGNLLSLIIFVPIKIRRVSTGLLFLLLTLSNNMQLLTLFIEFLEFTYEGKADAMRHSILEYPPFSFQFPSFVR